MNYRLIQPRNILAATSMVVITTLTSCGPTTNTTVEEKKVVTPLKAEFVNPYKSGTYNYFKAKPGYPKTYNVYKNTSLLAKTNSSNSSVVIDLSEQRARLMNGSTVVMDYPVSTGKSAHKTPTGTFYIKEKIVDKRSNLYGKILDKNGNVVKSGADSRKDKPPAGGKFLGAAMAHWMRLTNDGIGMHKGRVPRYPASHGCIRTPGSVVPIVFSKVKSGTKVTIKQ